MSNLSVEKGKKLGIESLSKASQVTRLLEEAGSDSDKLASDIESAITSIFPDSYVSVRYGNNIAPAITIAFALGKNRLEWSNGIIHNDPAHTLFLIYGMEKDGSIKKPLEPKYSMGGITVKSTNPYMVYGTVKVPFRQTKGDANAMLKLIKTYFERLKKLLQENRDKMTDEHLKLVGNKF